MENLVRGVGDGVGLSALGPASPRTALRELSNASPLASDLEGILSATRELWEELRGGRLFITGGTGFFGCWLLESFVAATDKFDLGASAVVLTRNPAAFRQKAPHLAGHASIKLHLGDVRSFEPPDGTFTHVVHAATDASASVNAESPRLMLDTIIRGTERTLDFARRSGARKVLFTSSGAVYGRQPPSLLNVSEEYEGAPDPTDPRSAYGEGKRVAELLCSLYTRQYGLEAKIARCFAFVGPYLPLDRHFAIGNFIRDGLAGKVITVTGDGTPYRSYLYAADLATWLWTILFRGVSCRPYNVGSEEAISIADLADAVASVFEPKRGVHIATPRVADTPAERYVPSTRRARSNLGLEQTYSLSEAIGRTIAWWAPLLTPRHTQQNL